MTRITYTQEASQANHSDKKNRFSKEDDQITYFKRLLVTLKQQYEKNLQDLNERLHNEMNQREVAENRLSDINNHRQGTQNVHEEELNAIKQQQTILKNLLKNAQSELKHLRSLNESQPSSDQSINQQRVEQLERMVSYWKERADGGNVEAEKLNQEIENSRNQITCLQSKLSEMEKNYEKQFSEHSRFSGHETEFSSQSILSDPLKQEIEAIKNIIFQETHSFEKKYIEILQDKIILENQVKDLQKQLEHQSSNLHSFKEQLQASDKYKRQLEETTKEQTDVIQKQQAYKLEAEKKIGEISIIFDQKIELEEKYEHLSDDRKNLLDQLNESIEVRIHMEECLSDTRLLVREQEILIAEHFDRLEYSVKEKEGIYNELQHIRYLLEESEDGLATAQQHLAKKVKENALLGEQINELQSFGSDCQQQLNSSKIQINHLQNNVDLYQRQEKKLQEQLHEALKSTENQVSKWEEKYFSMYEKWQETEVRLKDFKKLEEKHLQMQNVLANLGSFMGTSLTSSSVFREAQETMEKSLKPAYFEFSDGQEQAVEKFINRDLQVEEKYDLFGMKHSQRQNIPE